MAILIRLLMVMLAYVLACVAAAVVLTIGTLTPRWDQFGPQGIPAAMLWIVMAAATAIIGVAAILPSFLVIALAEGFAWRSVVLYGVLGAILALALPYGIDFAGYAGPDASMAHEREVLAASGIAGGLVYWLFAGRLAGAWKV